MKRGRPTNTPHVWTPERVAELKRLKATFPRSTHRALADMMGVSVGSIAGAIWRHIHGNYSNRRKHPPKVRQLPAHYGLVEPWAHYTARKKRERAEALSRKLTEGCEP